MLAVVGTTWTHLRALLALLLVACSSKTLEHAAAAGNGGVTETGGGDTSLFVPAQIASNTTAGEATALSLLAFTLVKGPSGSAEFYAAVHNEGMTAICEPGMLLNFFDQAGAPLASAGIPLYTKQLYRLTDGTVIPCVDPGQLAMGGSTTLPPEVVIDELGHFEYAFPAFVLNDITPATALGLSPLQTARTLDGTSYSGTLLNTLETPASASVNVFPLNAVGRPLGMATASDTDALQPGDTWSFQTSTVRDPGVGTAVYPSANAE